MKKQFSWIVLFIAISLISCIFGCKEPEIETDTKAPANVTKLTITAADGNAVLTWKNPSDADFDGVQVSMSPAEGTLLNPVILGKNVTSLNVGGLTVGKEYTFTVKAFDESLNYSEGAEAKATVADTSDIIAPAEVTELTVQAANGNAVLNWKNPTDADFAGVQISMNPPEGTLLNPFILGKDVTSFNVSGITDGKEYTFTVKSFDTSLNYSEGTSVNAIIALKTIITSVTIPVAGIGYAGNVLPVTINGKNFMTLGAVASGFTSTGATLNNVTIISDTKAKAEITCPSVVGTTNVTVSYGESSATTTLKVIESVASSYAVGDIVKTDDNKPIGVVAMISDVYGVKTPKVIGLQRSAGNLEWALDYSTGYNTKFTNIVCTPSKTGNGTASTATFTGDTEGSDNWEEICAVDPTGTENAVIYYPIFNFANTYGTTAGLTGTDYENGWYVPSIAELSKVYCNKNVIQNSLTKVSGFEFGTSFYWSSSQSDYNNNYQEAYQVYFGNGNMFDYHKNDNVGVFVLHTVTAK